MKKLIWTSLSILILGGCASQRGPMAMATLQPTSGSTAQGVLDSGSSRAVMVVRPAEA